MKRERKGESMLTKDNIRQMIDLENADFGTVRGVDELQRRVEKAVGLVTEHKLIETSKLFSGENTDEPTEILTALDGILDELMELDTLLDDKRSILKNEAYGLSPVAWKDIAEVEREWLIPNWLPAHTVTMFTGQGGTGKSWLTLQIACEIASHADPMAWKDPDYEVKQPSEYDDSTYNIPKHIVFATYEDEPAEIKRRLNVLSASHAWIASERKTIKKHLHIVDMRGVGSVWGPGYGNHIGVTGELLWSGTALREVSEDLKAELLILDPLSGAFGGNENDRTAVYDFVSSFRGWCDAAKCAMLLIGHLPKGAEGKAAGFSGSTAWEASARAMWLLGTKEDVIGSGQQKEIRYYYALTHSKSNYALRQKDIPLAKGNTAAWYHASVDEACNFYETYHADPEGDEDDELTEVKY